MFCPDCGRESGEMDHYCLSCGFPIGMLADRLREESREVMGWAEKIVGKPSYPAAPPGEPQNASFATGEAVIGAGEEPKSLRVCEQCGHTDDEAILCPSCGDRLPSHLAGDPFLSMAMGSIPRLLFAPRRFAADFPYPASGAGLQALLYPGIFTALFIGSLPLINPGGWLKSGDPLAPFIPALAGIPVVLLVVPLLVYATSRLIHTVARLLGGRSSFRRCARIVSASLIWIMIYGTLFNVGSLGVYLLSKHYSANLGLIGIKFNLHKVLRGYWSAYVILLLVFLGWQFSWMFGGLYRLQWWKALVLTLATYVTIFWWSWTYLIVILPLRAGGLM